MGRVTFAATAKFICNLIFDITAAIPNRLDHRRHAATAIHKCKMKSYVLVLGISFGCPFVSLLIAIKSIIIHENSWQNGNC